MIVDTSIWVDYFRDVRNSKTDLVDELLRTNVVFITSTILQEVLQGIHKDSQFEPIKRGLMACALLQYNPVKAAIEAAEYTAPSVKKA